MSDLLARLMGGVYREEVQSGDAGGAAGGAGAAGAAAAPGAGTGAPGGAVVTGGAQDKAGAGDAGTGKAGGESLIDEAKRLAAGAAPASIPEKYLVKDAAGAVDEKASALKLAAAYSDLEKRMGAGGGLPPTKSEDYKLEVLEGEKEAPKLDDALGKLFRDEALAAGLTQAQYNRMVRSGNKIIAQAVGQASGQGQGQARAELIKHYGSEDGFKQAAARAYQGFAAFADDADMKAIDSIGDLPVFIRVFDRIAAELGEDKLPNFNPDKAAGEVAEIDRLTRDTKSEYWDSKKPGHAAAVAKVAAWNERQVAQKNRKLA